MRVFKIKLLAVFSILFFLIGLFCGAVFSENIDTKTLIENIKKLTNAIQRDPQIFSFYHQRGVCYYQLGDYQKAIADLKTAISLNEKYTPAFNYLGLSYQRFGDIQKALENFNMAVKMDPKDVNSYINRGNLYLENKEFEKALNDYSTAIKSNPQDVRGYFYRGNLYLEKDQYEEAIKDYDKAVNIKPDLYPVYNNRGICLFLTGNFSKAIDDFSKVIETNPDIAPASNNRGMAYQKNEEYIKAIEDFKKAVQLDKNYTVAYNNLGRAYLYLNRLDEAQKALDAGISLEPPEELKVFFNWNMARLECRKGNLEAAVEYIKKCIQYDPLWKELARDNLDFKPLWKNKEYQDLIGKVRSKFKHTILLVFNHENSPGEKELKEKLILLRKNLGLAPEDLGFKLYHISNDDEYSICCENLKIKTKDIPGIFLVKLSEVGGIEKIIERWPINKLGEAWDELEKVSSSLELEPESPEDYNSRGIALQKTGDYEKAIIDFKKAIQMDPGLFMAYNNLGSAYLYLNKYELAEEYLEKGLSLLPPPDIKKYFHWNLARLAGKEKNKDEALKQLKACVQIEPAWKNLIRNSLDFQILWENNEYKNLIGKEAGIKGSKYTLLLVFNRENTESEELLKKQLIQLRAKAGLAPQDLPFKLFHINKEEEYNICCESLGIDPLAVPGVFLVQLNELGGIKKVIERWAVEKAPDAWNELLKMLDGNSPEEIQK